MKSVLISIQPKWCELIASGKKTIEVRKTRPKIKTPFKCYIYCTLDGGMKGDMIHALSGDTIVTCGKVIGEFVCDYIGADWHGELADYFEQCGCVTMSEQIDYAGNKTIYGWHISNLVIYDKPKELGDFVHCKKFCEDCPPLYFHSGCIKAGVKSLTRTPLSWMYVEEVK